MNQRDILTQIGAYERLHEETRVAKQLLENSLFRVMKLLIPRGSILEKHDRSKPWSSFKTLRGSDYNAKQYEIVEVMSVVVDRAHVEGTLWRAHAWSLNSAGKRMNSKTYKDGMVWIEGQVCRDSFEHDGELYKSAWRAKLMEMVDRADQIQSAAELDEALKGE